jgi:hypothetical protein
MVVDDARVFDNPETGVDDREHVAVRAASSACRI